MSRRRVSSSGAMDNPVNEADGMELGSMDAASVAKKRSGAGAYDVDEETEQLLDQSFQPAPGTTSSTAFAGSSRQRGVLNYVKAWWKGPKTWRTALGIFVGFVIYYYLVRMVNTPLQLRLDAPQRFCPYLDTSAIELRRAGLPNSMKSSKMKLGIVTFFGNMDPEMRAASIANKETYAARHGYDVIVADEDIDKSRPAAWSKFIILKKYLDKYQYLMWMDADALFMNMTIRVEDLIDSHHELFFARDEADINSGIFLIRNSEWSKWWLDQAWDQTWLIKGSHPFKYEQRAIQYMYGVEAMEKDAEKHNHPLYEHREDVRSKTQVLPYCAFNSNICEEFWTGLILFRRRQVAGWICDNVYANGDFIIHFAGKTPSSWRNWLFLEFAELAKQKDAL
mmetsp:Transcript_18188/g.35723  ORF Transcript_18188/g.35723 Transcript_18188/m.35723 type:complete len:394 (-) Transcript_18188:225-1406(-)